MQAVELLQGRVEDPRYSGMSSRDLILRGIETTRTESILLHDVITESSLIDEVHADELAQSIITGKYHQLTPITVRAKLNEKGMVVYDVIDGFHRSEGLKRAGRELVEAKILFGCSDEELYHQRILAASSVKSVEYPRIAEWVTKAWDTTEWAKKGVTAVQAFQKTINDREKNYGVKLTPAELEALKDWVRSTSGRWKRSIHSTHNILKIISEADPDLVKQVRESEGGVKDREGKITPGRLKAAVEAFPRNFPAQRAILQAILERRLSLQEAEQLIEDVQDRVLPGMSEAKIYRIASEIRVITPDSEIPRTIRNKEKDNGEKVVFVRPPQIGRDTPKPKEGAIKEALGEREPTVVELRRLERGLLEDDVFAEGDETDVNKFGDGDTENLAELRERIRDLEDALEEAKKGSVAVDTWWRTAVYLSSTERDIFERVMFANESLSMVGYNHNITEVQVVAYIRSAFKKRNILEPKRKPVLDTSSNQPPATQTLH